VTAAAVAVLLAVLAAGPAAAGGVLSVTYTALDPGDDEENAGGSLTWNRFVSPGGRRLKAVDRAFERSCGFHDCAGFSFSPGGRRVVATGRDNYDDRAVLWLGSFPRPGRLRAVHVPLTSFELSDAVLGPAGRIAFAGQRYGRGPRSSRVWTVDRSGKGLELVGAGTAPGWSSRGALAFSSPRGLFVRQQTGSRPLRVRRTGASPAWSPDGSRIAFSDGGDIVVMLPTGIALRRLTSGSSRDRDPVWSPDGREIAFVRQRVGKRDRLERVPASGGVARPVVTERAFEQVLDFEPDSSGLRLHDWRR